MKHNLMKLAVVAFAGLIGLSSVFGFSRTSNASNTATVSAEDSRLKPCSNETLNGRYAVSGSGTKALGGLGPISIVGWGNFDGNGGVTGRDTVSLNGDISRRDNAGTYQVNENCTGTLTFVVPPPRNIEVHFDLVIVDEGEQAFLIQTDPGTDLRVEIKRQ